MKIEQKVWNQKIWKTIRPCKELIEPQVVFVFASLELLSDTTHTSQVLNMYPKATLIGCSTAGEIGNIFVKDDSMVITAVQFEKTTIQFAYEHIVDSDKSFEVGKTLMTSLLKEDLKHILIFSDGLTVNGTQLIAGCLFALPEGISLSGGLAAHADKFDQTVVITPDGISQKNCVVAMGLYGNDLKVSCASIGGWDIFGIERLVTKSHQNILYEIDNEPALQLYKSFLGENVKDLPGSALLFPLSIRTNNENETIVRTILAINEEDQSMTFAGDIPNGSYVRLMKANIDRLIDGAVDAATLSLNGLGNSKPELAILVSCVGRKLVLKQIVEEEIEGVMNVLGDQTVITGFYSYGEISPFKNGQRCELHNQTMTITSITEN